MNCRLFIFAFLGISYCCCGQQQTSGSGAGPTAGSRDDPYGNPVTLAVPAEHSNNFLNFSLSAYGVYDHGSPTNGNVSNASTDSYGFEGGWGVSGTRSVQNGSIALSYHGDYRNYGGNGYSSGTDHNLVLALRRTLSRRWSVSYSQAAGIFLNGASYFSIQPSQTGTISLNPFSRNTKFLSSGLTMTYQQSRRLSYDFGGDFYLSRYSGLAPFGTVGGAGTAAAIYRLTARSTVSGTYSFNAFEYQHGGGESQIHTVSLGISHIFGNRWSVGASGGVSRSNSSGNVTLAQFDPALIPILGSNFVVGRYKQTVYLPYFEANASRRWLHSSISLNAGQSVTPGNGIYLASRNLHLYGIYSYTYGKSSIGLGGGYSRLGSVSVTAGSYTTDSFSASYGYSLLQHLGLNARYDLINYDGIGSYGGRVDNRFSVGVIFNSKSVPITLF